MGTMTKWPVQKHTEHHKTRSIQRRNRHKEITIITTQNYQTSNLCLDVKSILFINMWYFFFERKEREKRKRGLDGCTGGGGCLSLVVLVSEKHNLVSDNINGGDVQEKSGKSQGILFICGAGNHV